MKSVIIENNELRLNSNIDEMYFGKLSYSSLITQNGVLAKCDSTPEEQAEGKYHFTFENWYFSGVKSFALDSDSENKTQYVFYCGQAGDFTENSKTLLEYFENAGAKEAGKAEKDEMFKAAFCICSLLTQAALEKIELPINGAAGILISSTENPSILFLPQDLFRCSTNSLSKTEFANAHGCWTNSTLIDLPAICFMRGVIAYKMLTGRFPFAESDEIRRNADIFDKKFLPLDLCLNGINKKLATEVNKALQLNANVVNIPGKKVKGKSNEDLTPTAEFPLDLLFTANQTLEKNNLSDEEFLQKAEFYLKNQNSKVETKRKLRRNKSRIITILIFAFVFAIFIVNTIKTKGQEYTSKGLTSTQTIEGYFQGMNSKDSTLSVNMAKGSKVRRFTDSISQMYVISKQRQHYTSGDNGFVEPERWVLYVNDSESDLRTGMYGVTQLYIDGKLSNLDAELYTIAERPDPVTSENGLPLKSGATISHQIEYYLLHSEGTDTDDNGIVAEHMFGTAVLTYSGKKWSITDFQLESEPVEFDSYQFKKDYYEALKATDGDVKSAVKRIDYKYFWLPTETAIENCIQKIKRERQEYAQEFEAFFK